MNSIAKSRQVWGSSYSTMFRQKDEIFFTTAGALILSLNSAFSESHPDPCKVEAQAKRISPFLGAVSHTLIFPYSLSCVHAKLIRSLYAAYFSRHIPTGTLGIHTGI